MKISRLTTMRELAFVVCTELHRRKLTGVLTGGAAAHLYAPESYVSQDLDIVLNLWSSDNVAREAIASLGFSREGRNMRHQECPFTVEFPPGPLAVGEEQITTWSTWHEGEHLLHIITPTDCVRDRLAGYLFWHDRQSLAAAVAVAKAQAGAVDLKFVEDWCGREGESAKYEDFRRQLERGGLSPTADPAA